MARAPASGNREEEGRIRRRSGLPTGQGTASRNDVADPHPATEEDYDRIPRPGGTNAPDGPDIGANSYAHDGKAPPRPKNEGAKP
jgi:hypothetical protein